MRITEREQAGATVLALAGEFVGEAAAQLRKQASRRLATDGRRDIVLDCTEVYGIDSAGLETLLWLQDACAERLGHVRLAACPATLDTVLRVTRLAGQFDRHASVDEAVAAAHTLAG
ncbi:MAG: STAS domain-containing protein [Phycisphaeraceae bacterium]